MDMGDHEAINDALRHHHVEVATSWDLHSTASRLHEFFGLFNNSLFAPHPLPPAAISLDRTRRSLLGHYVPGRNGTGVCHNINVNSAYLGERSLLEQLVTLAHEMVHEQQELYGTPSKTGWYHNKEFCALASAIGIVAQRPKGYTIKITDPFVALCREHGVDDPVPEYAPRPRQYPGRSTLNKWSCRCSPPVNIRVAIAHFNAT